MLVRQIAVCVGLAGDERGLSGRRGEIAVSFDERE